MFTHVYRVYLRIYLFTYVYTCLPMFTTIDFCMFTYADTYTCLPLFTIVYLCLTLFTDVYLCLLVFTYIHTCLHLFCIVLTYGYSYLSMFTTLFHAFSLFIGVTNDYHCIFVCVPMFTHVY